MIRKTNRVQFGNLSQTAVSLLVLLLTTILVGCQAEAVVDSETAVTVVTPQPTDAPTVTPIPTDTATPTILPSPTLTSSPTETATPVDTATPAATSIPRESIGVETEDGKRLFATLIGDRHETIAIFSNMSGGSKGEWRQVAQFLAMHNVTAITYDYRETISNFSESAPNGVLDLQAMISLAQEIGGVDIFLVGASMGGTITAKTAAQTDPAGVVLISAPILARSLAIDDEEFASIVAPLLIVNSRSDDFYQDTVHMIDVATSPTTSQIFSGSAHGTEIFGGEDGEILQQLILDFIQEQE